MEKKVLQHIFKACRPNAREFHSTLEPNGAWTKNASIKIDKITLAFILSQDHTLGYMYLSFYINKICVWFRTILIWYINTIVITMYLSMNKLLSVVKQFKIFF